ncbi:MAG: PE family protein, partial [Mycobacterium sp.]
MASATGSLVANPVTDFIRIFIGDGTASNPNGGRLIGSGYSWTADTGAGVTACTGGNGGFIGNGGSGYNGGDGGAGGNVGALSVWGSGGGGGTGGTGSARSYG